MVHAPPARNIFPALLSIFRPRSPDILPPCGRGNFSPTYFRVPLGPSSAEMTAPARRRKVSGGARSGCLPGVLARGCPPGAARWEHPPRPAPRTLILPGGRRRLGGGRGHPAPSLALGSWLWVTQTTVPGNQGRRGPEPEPCPRIVPLPFGWPCVFVGAIRVERSLHRGGEGGGSAPGAVTSTGRRPGASEAGPAAGAHFAAQLWRALGNFCPPPAGPIFCEFWGFPSSSHPAGSAEPGWEGGGVERLETQCAPPPSGPAPCAPSPPAVS